MASKTKRHEFQAFGSSEKRGRRSLKVFQRNMSKVDLCEKWLVFRILFVYLCLFVFILDP